MAEKKFVGTFQSENQVLNKIDELKAQGYEEEDIYVVTNNTDSLTIVRRQTDVDLRPSDGNWLDRFTAFLSGDEPVRAAFTNMGFTEEESSRYYNEVKNGNILLYVDREYGNLFYDSQTEIINGTPDPNLGSNLITNRSDTTGVIGNPDQEERIRLHEERLNVDKERVQAGEINIDKHVIEDEQTVEVPVSREEVYIERRAVNDETAADEVFDDGENLHIPIMKERLEVTKRPVVSEEIIVGKRRVQDTETVRETVRREEAEIDRTDDVVNNLDGKLETNRSKYNALNDRDRL